MNDFLWYSVPMFSSFGAVHCNFIFSYSTHCALVNQIYASEMIHHWFGLWLAIFSPILWVTLIIILRCRLQIFSPLVQRSVCLILRRSLLNKNDSISSHVLWINCNAIDFCTELSVLYASHANYSLPHILSVGECCVMHIECRAVFFFLLPFPQILTINNS